MSDYWHKTIPLQGHGLIYCGDFIVGGFIVATIHWKTSTWKGRENISIIENARSIESTSTDTPHTTESTNGL